MNISRNAIVAYKNEPCVPLKVISDPFEFNGQMVVTARKVAKKKKRTASWAVLCECPCALQQTGG